MKSTYQDTGSIPVIDQGKDYIAGYTDDPALRYDGPLPLTIFGDHTRILKWVDQPFAVGADGTQLLRGDHRFDQRYFYYALCSLELEHFGYERHFKYLKEEQIPLPPLPTQRRIAGILSAYDDLIENNLRRIKILEEMAQSLYREWFVHFRFPGHESVKLVDSELGKIPEGWEILPINGLCSLKSGYAFKSKDFDKDGEWPLVTIKNVQDRNFIPDCQNALAEVPTKAPEYCHLRDGDLLLSLTGNIGRVCIVYGGSYLLNQRVAKLIPENKTDSGFVYCFFADEDTRTRLENIASGVAQQNLSPVQTGKTCLKLPPQGLLADFAAFANKTLDQVVVLQRRNQTLRKTRDLLLPKLLSGSNASTPSHLSA